MRLTSVRVCEFKSVLDSGEFETGDITCLVGKNEAGKTAVLEALYRLNPVISGHGNFNVTHDYPRTAWPGSGGRRCGTTPIRASAGSA